MTGQVFKVYDHQVSLKHLRFSLLLAILLGIGFMVPDLAILPEHLKPAYLISRLVIQIPAAILLLGLSYWKHFERIRFPAIFTVFLIVTYANFYAILSCWILGQVAFPYEGTILYTLFVFYIFRLPFRYALAFTCIVTLGFSTMLFLFPIYGDRTMINLGFAISTLLMCLAGVHAIEQNFRDASEANETLLLLNRLDHLTSLLNRGAFDEQYETIFSQAKRFGQSVAMFMVDIDYFKQYNDQFGHQKGDAIIQTQAEILQEVFQRESDCIARYGGEEFAVVVVGVDEKQQQCLAEKVLNKWHERAEPHAESSGNSIVNCSIGICAADKLDGVEREALIACADKALYRAKNAGRGQYQTEVFDSSEPSAEALKNG